MQHILVTMRWWPTAGDSLFWYSSNIRQRYVRMRSAASLSFFDPLYLCMCMCMCMCMGMGMGMGMGMSQGWVHAVAGWVAGWVHVMTGLGACGDRAVVTGLW